MKKSLTIAELISTHITVPVKTEILPISEVNLYIKDLLVKYYKLQETISGKIVDKYLGDYLSQLKGDLYVLVESPYVDKLYRDTYYNFYSSKLNPYYRDCIRLSFFNSAVSLDDLKLSGRGDEETKLNSFLQEHYLGFLVVRPTFPKIIGRNCISPKAKKEDNILCCLAKIGSTVNSIKQKTSAFPHASQDTQTMTCAETTVWSLLEYFGNKYPEYKPVLLTHITKVMHRFSYKRLLPSDGLTAEQITYAIREFGFGSMIHSKNKRQETEFDVNYIISTYVESGIPVVGVLKNDQFGHAVNIIGREVGEVAKIVDSEPNAEIGGIPIVDFNRIVRKYVFIDDNHAPYQIAGLDRPCASYYEDTRWHDCEIRSIIVPLYHKIYLDAAKASKNFYNALGNSEFGLVGTEKRILKIFLASTRSYKQYLNFNKEINPIVKEMILALPMPKFVWIAEVSTVSSFAEGKCDELFIQDATEPMSEPTNIYGNMSLLVAYANKKISILNFGKITGLNTFAAPFESYKENLS